MWLGHGLAVKSLMCLDDERWTSRWISRWQLSVTLLKIDGKQELVDFSLKQSVYP